ncbi:hypothetical protein JCM8547_002242 [Rhodosporidiobolus lusitaniae]
MQIPPQVSPVLLPLDSRRSHRRSHSPDSFSLSNHHNPDIPAHDDLLFLPPGNWDDQTGSFREEEDDDEGDTEGESSSSDDDNDDGAPFDDDDDDDIEDWTLEDGHIQGVPCANVRLHAKQYQTPAFLEQLLQLLRYELAIPGWFDLPNDVPSSLIQVHKVSGSLTNAVFFVSIPETEVELETTVPLDEEEQNGAAVDRDGDAIGTPVMSNSARLFPATVFSELERGRQAAATPTPVTRAALTSSSDEATPSSAPGTPVSSPPPALPAHEPKEDEETSTIPGALPLDEDDSPSPSPTRRPSSSVLPPIRFSSSPPANTRLEKTLLSAPTLLLRIYGAQSGSLISRRNELHILHTLSSKYGIGAHVLGTFANGRVEEYFHSRALEKEEMRDPRVSRWIGRRMRELHGVDLEQMVLPPREEGEDEGGQDARRKRSRSPRSDDESSLERPGIDPLAGGGGGGRSPGSGASVLSTSSSSSVFSFGASSASSSYSGWSSSSARSSSTLGSGSIGSGGSVYGSNRYGRSSSSLVSSPLLLPQREASESAALEKKRPRRRGGGGGSIRSGYSGGGSSSGGGGGKSRRRPGKEKMKLCVWENILRWTREARLVLKELDALAQVRGMEKLLAARSGASTPAGPGGGGKVKEEMTKSGARATTLSHPGKTFDVRSALNLPLFEQQLRQYRSFVRRVERGSASLPPPSSSSSSSPTSPASPSSPHSLGLKSRRVFAHNDTQYGNLLLVTPMTDDPREEQEIERQAQREGGAHRRLIVVDFEYAGANPRGFDIANHFCEWQADYHHPSLSHSLSAHQPYPTRLERVRFLRAYVGCDGGIDAPSSSASSSQGQEDEEGEGRQDARVERLLDEVRLWEPSSHAMWAVWGIVQAKEDLVARIEVWRERARVASGGVAPPSDSSSSASGDAGRVGGRAVSPLSLTEDLKTLSVEEKEKVAEEMRDLAELDEVGEVFDYLSYALERMEMFRRELKALRVC